MASEEEQKEVQQKPGSKKPLIVALLFIVLLGAGGAGAYFKFIKKTPTVMSEQPKEAVGVICEMDTFMVNLADPGGKRFLKATMKLKVSSPEALEECKSRNFELRDMLLILLSGRETQEVATVQDKLDLKKQLIETLNRALRRGQVMDVYFTEFLIQ